MQFSEKLEHLESHVCHIRKLGKKGSKINLFQFWDKVDVTLRYSVGAIYYVMLYI